MHRLYAAGDPCAYGNLRAPALLTETIVRIAQAGSNNGYCHSAGTAEARAAVAAANSTPSSPLCAADVYITSGCSGSLDLVLSALLNPGDNVLLPQPSFPLYQVSCAAHEFDLMFSSVNELLNASCASS
jgi:aspartate/methionine/tyrosine aminotransferase